MLDQTAAVLGGDVTWHAAGSWNPTRRIADHWTPNIGPTTQRAGGSGGGGPIRFKGTAEVELKMPWGRQKIEVVMEEIARNVAHEEDMANIDFYGRRGGWPSRT